MNKLIELFGGQVGRFPILLILLPLLSVAVIEIIGTGISFLKNLIVKRLAVEPIGSYDRYLEETRPEEPPKIYQEPDYPRFFSATPVLDNYKRWR